MLHCNIVWYLTMKYNVSMLKLKEAGIRKLSTQWQEGYKSKDRERERERSMQTLEVLSFKKI